MAATSIYLTAANGGRLLVALEMGWSKIKVASRTEVGNKVRLRDIKARDMPALLAELGKAKELFGLPAEAPVQLCYEAGRDGFWLQRTLQHAGCECLVVDPGSVKVNRRRKRAKTDRLDVHVLLEHLLDHLAGKKKVWSVVRVPTLEQEDRRQLHRELETLKGERTEHVNRIKSLLALLGLELKTVKEDLPSWLSEQRLLENDMPVPTDYRQRLLREHVRWQLVDQQIGALEQEQVRRIAQAKADDSCQNKVKKLMRLKGIGAKSAWLFVFEIFGWRTFKNRRELGGMAGLAPTPYASGTIDREMGISKAGNTWLRGMLVEIAWSWLQWQPDSKLARWFRKRFGHGAKRVRKIGIVALARKLLIALWRWLEFDVWPEGADEVSWQPKVGLKAS